MDGLIYICASRIVLLLGNARLGFDCLTLTASAPQSTASVAATTALQSISYFAASANKDLAATEQRDQIFQLKFFCFSHF